MLDCRYVGFDTTDWVVVGMLVGAALFWGAYYLGKWSASRKERDS